MQSSLFSLIVSFIISLIIAPIVVKGFYKLKNGQPILHYVESHYVKSGTPTMGGVIFIVSTCIAYLTFYNNFVRLATICLASMLGYGLLGFLDDFIKVKYKNNQGLKAYQKAIGQVGIAVLVSIFVYNSQLVGSEVLLPFTSNLVNFSWLIIPFVVFIYLSVTNSVNLIDGLDGLSGWVSFVYLIGFSIALFLRINNLQEIGESLNIIYEYKSILTLSLALGGGLLGFLCFNSHPAKIFMGDTGSLAIGGFISAMAVLTKMYLYLPFFGIMYVLTTLSVIIQVLYYKATKKRVFLMAPLHHHFEKKGWHETKIVAIYIVITIVAGVSTIAFIL